MSAKTDFRMSLEWEGRLFESRCALSAIARFLEDRGTWKSVSRNSPGPDALTADEEFGLSVLCRMVADTLKTDPEEAADTLKADGEEVAA